MRIFAHSPKAQKVFRSGKTFWRCLVKKTETNFKVVDFPVHLTGSRTKSYGATRIGKKDVDVSGYYLWDLFGHSNSVVTFTTRKEAKRFKAAVLAGDTSVPFVREALKSASEYGYYGSTFI